jgi:hypothetical protein
LKKTADFCEFLAIGILAVARGRKIFRHKYAVVAADGTLAVLRGWGAE